MSFAGLSQRDSPVHRSDPRARLAICSFFLAGECLCSSYLALSIYLLMAIAFLVAARIAVRELGWRLLSLNFFLLALVALAPGEGGGLGIVEGFKAGAWGAFLKMALRCNGMLFAICALASSIEMASFGHALSHFGIPKKLGLLLLFSVRQIETLRLEYLRLKDAMRARGFRPRCDIHTYKSLATLAGMLLVRSFDRSARIAEAMKCRAFTGHFHLADHFKMRRSDWIFSVSSCIFIAFLSIMERVWKMP